MHRLSAGLAWLLAALFFAGSPVHAAVFHVTDVIGLGTALDDARNNGEDDTINVAAGTYSVGSTLWHNGGESFSLTIAGAGPATTILDGGGTERIMAVKAGGDVTIEGLAFRNGGGTNVNVGGGGALWVGGQGTGTTTAVTNCRFENNSSISGGAGGAALFDGMVTVTDSVFTGNTMTSPGFGGGLSASGVLTVINSTFSNNGGGQTHGGGAIECNCNTVTITDSTFSGNTVLSGGQGGAVSLTAGDHTITGSTFTGNKGSAACGPPGQSFGGALSLYSYSGSVTISENTFTDNGFPCGANYGSAVNVFHLNGDGTQHLSLVNNVFFNNASQGTIAAAAGVIRLESARGTVSLTNNTFSGNDSGDPAVADIWIGIGNSENLAAANIYNNIFWGGAGEDVLAVDDSAATGGVPVRIFNNDLDMAATTVTPGSDYLFGDNLNVDPLFVDMAGGDLHITAASPVKDMGLDTAPAMSAVDIDGDTRILDGTVDMGADEFKAPPAPATFVPATGILDVPEVHVVSTNLIYEAGTKTYQAQLKRRSEPGYVFELAGAAKTAGTPTPAATFSTKTGVLDIPTLQVQGLAKTYSVQMRKRAGVFIFDLVKARKN